MPTNAPLWTPSPERRESANLHRFVRFVRNATGSTVAPTDLRLNEPHFIKSSDILKAASKPIEPFELATHGGEIKTVNYTPPPKRSRGVEAAGIDLSG